MSDLGGRPSPGCVTCGGAGCGRAAAPAGGSGRAASGWGREGPLADRAGHDLNYLALAGVLAHLGRADQPPTPPLNLVGDYGGGAMLLLVGVLGPESNAHGPDEFLHLPTARRVTATVADVLQAHAEAEP